MVCDCMNDCYDMSDEDMEWSGCDAQCSGAQGKCMFDTVKST